MVAQNARYISSAADDHSNIDFTIAREMRSGNDQSSEMLSPDASGVHLEGFHCGPECENALLFSETYAFNNATKRLHASRETGSAMIASNFS